MQDDMYWQLQAVTHRLRGALRGFGFLGGEQLWFMKLLNMVQNKEHKIVLNLVIYQKHGAVHFQYPLIQNIAK